MAKKKNINKKVLGLSVALAAVAAPAAALTTVHAADGGSSGTQVVPIDDPESGTLNPALGIKNWAAFKARGATIKWIEKPDLTRWGEHDYKALITFPSGFERTVEIPVEVVPGAYRRRSVGVIADLVSKVKADINDLKNLTPEQKKDYDDQVTKAQEAGDAAINKGTTPDEVMKAEQQAQKSIIAIVKAAMDTDEKQAAPTEGSGDQGKPDSGDQGGSGDTGSGSGSSSTGSGDQGGSTGGDTGSAGGSGDQSGSGQGGSGDTGSGSGSSTGSGDQGTSGQGGSSTGQGGQTTNDLGAAQAKAKEAVATAAKQGMDQINAASNLNDEQKKDYNGQISAAQSKADGAIDAATTPQAAEQAGQQGVDAIQAIVAGAVKGQGTEGLIPGSPDAPATKGDKTEAKNEINNIPGLTNQQKKDLKKQISSAKTVGALNRAIDSARALSSDSGSYRSSSSGNLARTGAAVGVVAAVSAGLAGVGVFLFGKKRKASKEEK